MRCMRLFVVAAMFGCAVLALDARPAQAYWHWGYYHRPVYYRPVYYRPYVHYWGYPSYYYGYSYPYYVSTPVYVPYAVPSYYSVPLASAPVTVTQPAGSVRYSFYGPTGTTGAVTTTATPASNIAQVEMVLPTTNAEVWVDGYKTTSTGTTRTFHSPPLTPGKKYHYQIRASWVQNGETMTEERTIPVAAGQQSIVNFTVPSESVGAATP
ncbi:MAG: TIGR03000 domain-containing protein [Gemmataceae bacterium]